MSIELTPDQFEQTAIQLLDSIKPKGVDGSLGVTKDYLKVLVKQFSGLYGAMVSLYGDPYIMRGQWNDSTPYKFNELVTNNYNLYRAKVDNTGVPVTDTDTWYLVLEGKPGPETLPNGQVAAGDGRAVSGDEVFENLEVKGLNKFNITQDPVWQYAVTINGRVVFGVKRDGNKLWWKAGLSPELDSLLSTLNTKVDGNTAAIAAIKGLSIITDPIYSFLIKDTAGRVVFGIKKTGETVGSLFNVFKSLDDKVNNLIAEIEERFENVTLPENKLILSAGDSLSAAGQYQAEISEQLGSEYTVVNGGVGGENSRNIVARMGGLRSILTNAVTIPAAGTEVQIGDVNNSGLQVLDVDGVYYPLTWLRQGGSHTLNPLTIEGIECNLRWTGATHNDPAGLYMLKRNSAATEDYTTKANTEVFVSSLKKYRRPRLLIAWIGQNSGYANNDALVKQYKALISIVQPEDFVVIGLHSGTAASRADLEKLMTQEFGNRYINWRKYASERALRDMGITPTEADNTAMASGSCPPSLLTDAVHLTTAAGRQLGKLIIQTLKNINSWPTIV